MSESVFFFQVWFDLTPATLRYIILDMEGLDSMFPLLTDLEIVGGSFGVDIYEQILENLLVVDVVLVRRSIYVSSRGSGPWGSCRQVPRPVYPHFGFFCSFPEQHRLLFQLANAALIRLQDTAPPSRD